MQKSTDNPKNKQWDILTLSFRAKPFSSWDIGDDERAQLAQFWRLAAGLLPPGLPLPENDRFDNLSFAHLKAIGKYLFDQDLDRISDPLEEAIRRLSSANAAGQPGSDPATSAAPSSATSASATASSADPSESAASSTATTSDTATAESAASASATAVADPTGLLYVAVVGLGHYELPPLLVSAAEEIGRLLAREGYGLITGGWPGVDHICARAFSETLKGLNIPDEQRSLRVLTPGQTSDYPYGREEIASSEEGWYKHILEKAFALILIGGEGGTRKAFETAVDTGVPVIPLVATGGEARAIYQELVAEGHAAYPLELINPDPADPYAYTPLTTVLGLLSKEPKRYPASSSFDNENAN